jgi:hypothetical protein
LQSFKIVQVCGWTRTYQQNLPEEYCIVGDFASTNLNPTVKMTTRNVLRTLGEPVNSITNAPVSQPKVIVRDSADLHTLRRAFQGVYNGILNRLGSEELNSRTRTALLLRFSQLENSVFENVRRHTIVQTEDERIAQERAQRDSQSDEGPVKVEPFDVALQKNVDIMEAKLQALVKEVDDMRKSIPGTATSVRSFADELEKEAAESDGEDEENVGREMSADFNKQIYDALSRKVAMISSVVEELTEDVPELISNSINDLQAAHELLNAPQSRVDAAMATELTKRVNHREDNSASKKHPRDVDDSLPSAKTPRTTLRDMILNE